MDMLNSRAVELSDAIAICPNCGSCEGHENNRVDDALLREALKEVPRLRHEGRGAEVIELLTRYYAIRIASFVALDWRCGQCGVQFDG